MKRIIMKSSLSLVIGMGAIVGAGCQGDQTIDNKTSKVEYERTIDTNGKYPWETEQPKTLQQYLNKGETVFLLSDGKELEDRVKEYFSDNNKNKDKYAGSWSKYLELYADQIKKQYKDKEAYTDKLKEIQKDIESKKYNEVPTKVDEAKKLREA
ncbi:hypothetical protein LCD52_16150 [Rossellomorea vietnamensis]|uniref:hypothetical protein n=1 Tax=Rossellomorea vietnamensis TaxID=218284 RepID=UPI001CC9615F|nr:hypothetical protein [Rossellomorea vietnamensis]MCA0150317.1 hypothetical protein [Rossellomorea vietnamensis]